MSAVPRVRAELVLDARAELAECPRWDNDHERLLWVDINAGALHRLDPVSGHDECWQLGQAVGAVALRERGGVVLAVRDGFALFDFADLTLVAPVEADQPASRMNDGACDASGRFLAGTMACDATPGAGALYCLRPDLTVVQLIGGTTIPNGIGWSPDGATMYFADSATGRVDRFSYDLESGRLGPPRSWLRIIDVEGVPDGLTVDADGAIWVCVWGAGEVRRYAPDASLLAVVELPVPQPSACVFGGSQLDELYITTAWEDLGVERRAASASSGGIFRATPGVHGRPTRRFAG